MSDSHALYAAICNILNAHGMRPQDVTATAEEIIAAFTQLSRTEASSSAASAGNDPQAPQQEPNDG